MFQSSKGAIVGSGLVVFLVLAALGGVALYLGKVSPPAQVMVHHVLKQAQNISSSSDTQSLPDLPPVSSSGE